MFRESGLILVDLYVNGTKAFDSSNILSGTFSVNRFSSSAIAPEFGNVSAGELTFTIDTTTVTPTLQRGDIITGNLYLAEDTTETKAIGEFIVTNLVQGFNVLEVTCLDRMIELDIEANLSGVTYPITAEDFLTVVFHDTLGYTLNISNNVYKLVSLKQPVFEVGTTYRQVLSKVCECMGANAWYSDRLNIGWYTDSGETIDDSVYVNADLSDNGFGISVEVTQDPSQKAVDIGTDITLRIVNNPFLANATEQERTAIATAIQTNIGNVTFYGAVMTVLPMPELNPMDIVKVDGKDVPITSITYGLNENTKLEGKIDSDNNTYNYTPQRDIAIMKTEVEEVKENNKHFFYLDDSGVHITETENDFTTGNNILIDSDSVDIRDGTTTLASFGSRVILGNPDGETARVELSAYAMKFIFGNILQIGANLNNRMLVWTAPISGNAINDGESWETVVSATIEGGTNNYISINYRLGGVTYSIARELYEGTSYTDDNGVTVKRNSLPSSCKWTITNNSGSPIRITQFIGRGYVGPSFFLGEPTSAGNKTLSVGRNNTLYDEYSVAIGVGLQSIGGEKIVSGRFNAPSLLNAIEIGNGTDDTNRSNALTVDWNGNAVLAGDVTDGSGNVLSNVASKVTALQTWTTQTYTFQGLSITVKYNNAIPTLLRVKVYGTLNAVMNSASAYVTIASTGLTIPVPTLGCVQLNAVTGGQLRVNSNGDIQIGYTRNYGATANSNLASGAGVYIDQAIIVG